MLPPIDPALKMFLIRRKACLWRVSDGNGILPTTSSDHAGANGGKKL